MSLDFAGVDFAYRALDLAIEHLIWSVIALAAALCLCRIRSITPGYRAAILSLAMLLPAVGPLLPDMPIVPERAASPAMSTQPPHAPVQLDTSQQGSSTTAITMERPASSRPALELSPLFALLLSGLWLAGASWRMARLAIGEWRLRRIVAASRSAQALMHAHRDVLPASIDVRLTDDFGPAAAGIFRPTILIPHALADALPHTALRAVLLHERTHIERHDVLALRLQRLLEVAFWWNPLLHCLSRRLNTAREVACDVSASERSGSRNEYAMSLLDAFDHLVRGKCASPLPALGMAMSCRQLDERIDAIIAVRRPLGIAPILAMAAALLFVINMGTHARSGSPRMTPPIAVIGKQDPLRQREEARIENIRQFNEDRVENARQFEEDRKEGTRQLEEDRNESARQLEEYRNESARQLEEGRIESTRQREEGRIESARQYREALAKAARQYDERQLATGQARMTARGVHAP